MARITAIAKNEYSTCEASINVVEPEITDGYWVNEKGEKITSAYCEDKAFFRIITSSTKPKTKVGIVLYGSQFGPDTIISYYSSKKEVKQTNSRSGLINSNNYCDIPVALNAVRGYSAYSNNEIELYCECYFIDNNRNRIELPKDKSKYLRVSHLVGYLEADDCRIRVDKKGVIHWVPENCTRITRNLYYNYVHDKRNWTQNPDRPNQTDIGVRNSTHLMNFKIDYETPKSSIARMNRSRDPISDDTVIKIGIVIAESTGQPDGRVKQGRTIQSANPSENGRVVGASAALAVNVINYALENAPTFACYYDSGKVEDHFGVLVNNVISDIIEAINSQMIPVKYCNKESLYCLYNIVLCGHSECVDANSELYNIGKKIYRDISKCKKE